jgi:hypothetical protein
MSDTLNDHIGTSTVCGGLDLGDRVVFEVDRNGSKFPCLLQALRDSVDGVDGIHHGQSTSDGAETHGPAADGDGGELAAVTFGKVFEEAGGGEVACGKDVRHQDEHLFRDALWRKDEGAVGERTSDEFRLTSIDGVGGSTVAEELALGASRSLATNTVVALTTCCVEWDDDLR